MTGNQFGMKGRNLQNYLRYLKANECKGKELRASAVMEVRGLCWPTLNSVLPCSSSLTPYYQRCPPGGCAGSGEKVKACGDPRTNIALYWRSCPLRCLLRPGLPPPRVGRPGRVTCPVRVFEGLLALWVSCFKIVWDSAFINQAYFVSLSSQCIEHFS